MNFKELTYFLDGLVNKIGIPGIDCVVLKEHDMVYRHFAGYKDVKNKRKIEGNEIYNFHSPTKIITVVSALQPHAESQPRRRALGGAVACHTFYHKLSHFASLFFYIQIYYSSL